MPADSRVQSEDSTRQHTQPRHTQTWVNRQIQGTILDIQQNIAWNYQMVLTSVTCKDDDDCWLVIIKAYRGRHKKVAFVAGATYGEALELAGEFASRGCLTWKAARKPPWTRPTRKP